MHIRDLHYGLDAHGFTDDITPPFPRLQVLKGLVSTGCVELWGFTKENASADSNFAVGPRIVNPVGISTERLDEGRMYRTLNQASLPHNAHPSLN